MSKEVIIEPKVVPELDYHDGMTRLSIIDGTLPTDVLIAIVQVDNPAKELKRCEQAWVKKSFPLLEIPDQVGNIFKPRIIAGGVIEEDGVKKLFLCLDAVPRFLFGPPNY